MSRARTIAVAYDCLFPYTTGGGERQYRAFARRMAERGRTVDYLTARQWIGPEIPADEPFEVVPVSGRLALYDAAGVRRAPAAFVYAAGLFRVLRRRRHRYGAIIVSGLPVLNVFAARIALIGSGTRVVVDYLEVWGRRQWQEYNGPLLGTVAWILQRAAIAVTPIATAHSQLTARRLRAEGFRGRILVSPGLIDDDASAPVAPSPAAEPPYILYAGRHIPDKRVESLPAAVAVARERVPGLRLVILGDGPTSPAIDTAIARADGAAWIDRPGFVSEDELNSLMAAATALVNPSRREGYGLVVVEAAAHGTPTVLVADASNASTELISAGINGFVSPSTDPVDVAEAIVRVAEEGSTMRSRTRAWYEDALRTRTVERTVDAILDCIDAPDPSAEPTSTPSAPPKDPQ